MLPAAISRREVAWRLLGREQFVRESFGNIISQSNEMNQAHIILRDMGANAKSPGAVADNFLQL